MRYCNQCHRITTGEPMFCQYCGSTYNVKLCPSRHVNPRTAELCSQCGSRDLSTPAPRGRVWVYPLLYALSLVPGVLLLLVSGGFFFAFLHALLTNQALLGQFFALGILLGVVWYAYMHLPEFIRKLFRTIWSKPKKDSGHRH